MAAPPLQEQDAPPLQEQDAPPLQEQDAASKTAARRRGPRPPRPPDNKLFASYQNGIEDVNIHIFDISDGTYGLKGYIGTLSHMKYRQGRWSPVTVCGIPVTPLENPKSELSSFFIIRLIDSTNPRYKVDLLIRDSDLYFVGFRREVVVGLEEEEKALQDETKNEGMAAKKDKKIKGKEAKKAAKKAAKKEIKSGWGRWHQFAGGENALPDYFNATSCGANSSYGSAELSVGGQETFKEILTVLGTFEDGYVSKDRLQIACYSVMVMICEASRLRSVFYEVLSRIVHDCPPGPLSKELTEHINNWKQMGAQVLQARLFGHMEAINPLDKTFAEKFELIENRKHKVETLCHLIDKHDGLLLLIKYDVELLGFTEGEVDEIKRKARQRPTGGPAGRIELDFSHEAF